MSHPLQLVLERDPRYPVEAYEFVRDALAYAQEVMGMGSPEIIEHDVEDESKEELPAEQDKTRDERHLTGQELCEACRRYAIEQYGMMARVVLSNWNIGSTGNVGDIVYNLIGVDLMRKSAADRREDFDDVFDFKKAFDDDFDFAAGQSSHEQR